MNARLISSAGFAPRSVNASPRHQRLSATFLAVLAAAACAAPSLASFTDFDPNTPGIQSGSWTEPRKLWVTIPAGMAGNDRMMFEMGVSSWDTCLTRIEICFRNPGDAQPPAMDGIISVMLVAAGSLPNGVQGSTGVGVNTPANNGHGPITDAMIEIDMGALGLGNLLKNLGAHEFGHALGLDDVPHPATGRVDVMDPNFNQNSPFIAPTQADKMMLMEHYTVPTPTGAALLVLGGMFAGRRRRR